MKLAEPNTAKHMKMAVPHIGRYKIDKGLNQLIWDESFFEIFLRIKSKTFLLENKPLVERSMEKYCKIIYYQVERMNG